MVHPLLVVVHLDAEMARGERVVLVAADAGDRAVLDRGGPRAGVGAVVRAAAADLGDRHVPVPESGSRAQTVGPGSPGRQDELSARRETDEVGVALEPVDRFR